MSILDHAAPSTSLVQSLPSEIAGMFLSSTSSYLAASSTHSAVISAMTLLSSTNSTTGGESRPGAENGECKLLGPFALFIQGALGLLALLSLVYKRWREVPQRPLKIWAFDASKQVVGSALLHIANLLMSMLSSGKLTVKAKADDYQANPCSFYLLNLAIDTTLGIPILIILLRLLTHGFSLTPLGNPPESIQSGNYGRPPKAKWWLKQSFIYFLGLLGMKFCVFVIFQLCPWIIRVGDWALRWTEGNEMVQVFFVMLFFPVVMNALQYYIIDSFIKDQKPSDHEPIPSDDDDDDDIGQGVGTRQRPSRGRDPDGAAQSDDESLLTEDDADVGIPEDKDRPQPSDREIKLGVEPKRLDEYNPATDGEGSGSSGSGESVDPRLPASIKKANAEDSGAKGS